MLNNELVISYGRRPQKMVLELLSHINWANQIPQGASIVLKPNLVVAKPSWQGATTDPKLVEGVLQYLFDHGLRQVAIAEGSWIGERTARAFETCGYNELAKKYGIVLIDLQQDNHRTCQIGDLELNICEQMFSFDYLVNLPVLKGHCQTKITCSLKNLKGCIPDQEKRRFHTLGLHRPIACLNKVLATDLIIVDGLIGDLDFEEGGNPVQMDRIIVGTDPVLVDSYVADLLGYESADVPYITISATLGVGRLFQQSTKLTVVNTEHTVARPNPSRTLRDLARFVDEEQACSACYGSLVHALARLNEQGRLGRLSQKIAIGQGFRHQEKPGLGIGSCTSCFSHNLPGCPPTAKEILDFLLTVLD